MSKATAGILFRHLLAGFLLLVVVPWLIYSGISAQINTAGISSVGSIVSGAGLSVFPSSINWGTVAVGGSATEVINVTNTGSYNELLAMSTSNFVPANASQFMTLTWNNAGHSLVPQATISLTLTLTVSLYVVGITSFSFDITVMAIRS